VVYPKGDGHAVGVCQCEDSRCPDIQLTAAEIVLLELSWNKLARALCAGLSLDWKPADLGIPNARQIGSWSAEAVPVVLTIQPDECTFQSSLLELIARLRSRFIMVAPTARHVNAITRELLLSAGAALFPLETCVRMGHAGDIEALMRPGELFAEFSPKGGEQPMEDARRLLGMIRQFEGRSKRQSPALLQVFQMHFIEELSPEGIAMRLRCSRATVFNRLKTIEKVTGMPASALRRMSGQFTRMQDEMSRYGARHIHGRKMIYDMGDEPSEV
jgi:hypothetical protein